MITNRMSRPPWQLAIGIFLFNLVCFSNSFAAPSGQQIYEETLKRTPLFNDPQLTQYIENLGREVVSVSEMAGQPFTFSLLDSPDLNAFATADNFVYINRGLLNYVSNEAQLVAVIAHEVAHVTRDHVRRQTSGGVATQILSTVAGALAGSGDVYQAGMAYGNSKVRSAGRNHELEADLSGAQYMAALGYDVDQMISMLSIMKDKETVQKNRAKSKGAIGSTYHGIFSSHPRNDARLRAVVNSAKSLADSTHKDHGAPTFRRLTDGLIWGENFLAKENPPERYSNMTWRVRIDFPKDWTQTSGTAPVAVIGQHAEELATLSMTRLARTTQSPEEYLYNQLNVSEVFQGEAIATAGLKGFSGILKKTAQTDGQRHDTFLRVAVIYYKLHAYVFYGNVMNHDDFATVDPLFVEAISTFRPISRSEIMGQKPQRVHYIKATANTRFADLAKIFNLSKNDVEILRVINALYPSGEPSEGDIIKVFKQ